MMDYDIRHGRTYMYFKGEPLYPFGYGLSYTTFN
jgi:beta-glucosidase